MEDLTIISCNYNTPNLIDNLIKSIKKTCINVPKILIMENSYNDTLSQIKNKDFDIDYNFNSSHGESVNKAFTLIKTRYILLVDSDVLFLKDIKILFEKFKESNAVLMGEIVGDRGGKSIYPRVNPWFCFMDLQTLNNYNIKFYDHYRTKQIKSEKIYDIGSTMYEDVLKNDLIIANAKMENVYFKHYEGMSWRVQKYDPTQPDTDIDIGGTHPNKALYEYGLKVQQQYEIDTVNL
jgi:glycosyltransferase involved in cell wall biosynthesis